MDDDERDRRKLAEIIKRMDERKLTKESDARHSVVTRPVKTIITAKVKVPKGREEGVEMVRGGVKKTMESHDVPKKPANVKPDVTVVKSITAGAAQRDAVRRWAANETSDTELVTQSTVSKSSNRPKGAKKVSDKVPEVVVEDAQSLEIQDFIASQYPPVDKGVSSTVRLGRALVSGALGRRNDDPKLFGAAINIVECSVRLQTTKKKAKVPVSAAPPNSIESEADCGDTSDVHLSQSATDLGTQIELPGDGLEGAEPQTMGTPTLNKTSNSGRKIVEKSAGVSISIQAGPESVKSPRNVILDDFNRLLAEIEVSSLVQEELIRTEPQLASATTFLEIVTSGAPNKLRTGANPDETTGITTDAIPIKETFDDVGDETAITGVAVVEDVAVVTVRTDVASVMSAANIAAGVTRGLSLKEAKYEERMRVTRITAAKSLLKDELKKAYPSSVSIAAFRKAAYGDESCGETSSGPADVRSHEAKQMTETPVRVIEGTTGGKELDKVVLTESREAAIGTDEGTVGGESIVSRESRKRRADESPEREGTGSVRKGFPGVVSRSEAGCRIHVPPTAGVAMNCDETTETATEAHTDVPGLTTAMDIEELIDTPGGSAGTDSAEQSTTPIVPEIGVEAQIPTPAPMEQTGVEAQTTATAPMEQTGVEAQTTATAPIGQTGVEAQTTATATKEQIGVEAQVAVPTTALDMVVEAHGDTPPVNKEVIVGRYIEMPSLVSIAPVELVWTGARLWEPESGVSTEGAIKESRKDDIPGSSGEHEYTTDINLTTPMAAARADSKDVATAACRGQTPIAPNLNVGGNVAVIGGDVRAMANVVGSLAAEGWGRDAMMLEGIFRILEGMEPPWVTLSVLENAVIRFPHVNPDLLRHTIMSYLREQGCALGRA